MLVVLLKVAPQPPPKLPPHVKKVKLLEIAIRTTEKQNKVYFAWWKVTVIKNISGREVTHFVACSLVYN